MSYGSSSSADSTRTGGTGGGSNDPTRTFGTTGSGTATSTGGISSTGSTGSSSGTDLTASAQEMAGQAKDAAGQMTGQIKEQASTKLNDQKGQAAQGLSSVASAMTQVGDQLRDQNPQIAQFADTASSRIQEFSRQIEQKDITALMDDVERFARSQPLAFLGGAFALGLLGARFLKSSSPNSFKGYPSSGSRNMGMSGYSGYSRVFGLHRRESHQ
jgi:hypothetical protein